jgi:RNA polymerase sigma-70 factor (ECF subfamily)
LKPDKIKTEFELVQDLRRGVYDAFDELFNEYCSTIFHFAVSILKSKEEAEEVVQNTFLIVWEKRQSIDYRQSFKSFIFTIAHNITIDTFRRKIKEKKYRDHVLINASIFYDQEEFHISNDLLRNVERIIEELPDRRREIFKLRKEKGFSYKKIADELDISVKTVENSINLAVKYIKSRINKGSLIILFLISLFL